MTRQGAASGPAAPMDHAGAGLMAVVLRGDVDAFEAVYDDHAARVLGLARSLLKDEQDAEEVTGDVFLAAWRSAARFDPLRGSLVSWLLAITRNRSIDRIRARSRAQENTRARLGAERRVDDTDPVGDEVHVEARARDVGTVLASLPERERRALSLAIVDGYSHSEIALLIGVPVGTVKSRIRLGLVRLRATLARGGPPAALLGEVLSAG